MSLSVELDVEKKGPGEDKPKKGAGRPKSPRDDATTKFDRYLLGKAQYIAREQRIPVAEYLEKITRAVIDRDYAKLLKDYERREKKES